MRLLWWALAVVSVRLPIILLSHERRPGPVQNASLTVAAPAENGLREAAAPISDFFE